MNFEFSDEQNMLREQAQSFLKAECPPQAVRTVLDGDAAFDQGLWQKVVDMGWTATAIPEEYDGLGLSYLELSVIAEELGRCLAPLPFRLRSILQQKPYWPPGPTHKKPLGCQNWPPVL